ncbi:MAG: helix-turn-helix domain-containing protein [Verrucomicrobiota bacterium]
MNMQTIAIPSDDRLLTEKEAAEYLRIKVRQLYNWRVSGLIPYIKIGKALRYRKAAIDQALERFTMGRNENL